jgi:ketosteroid isomerase-like protein
MRRVGRMLSACVVALSAAVALAPAGLAHPPTIVGEAGEKAVADEIRAFRKAMADAIAAKDAARLREMYAPAFVHTHTTAKTDNRDARIVSALSGDPIIENAPVEDLVVRVPNDWVAVATGVSPIKSAADGKTYAVRWTSVYTRTDKSWWLVASHATRSHEIKP